MMAAMGLAGVGGLALKALGVSLAALMLAGIVALKKVSFRVWSTDEICDKSGDSQHRKLFSSHKISQLNTLETGSRFLCKKNPSIVTISIKNCVELRTFILQQLTEGGGDGGHSVHYVRETKSHLYIYVIAPFSFSLKRCFYFLINWNDQKPLKLKLGNCYGIPINSKKKFLFCSTFTNQLFCVFCVLRKKFRM